MNQTHVLSVTLNVRDFQFWVSICLCEQGQKFLTYGVQKHMKCNGEYVHISVEEVYSIQQHSIDSQGNLRYRQV